MRHQGRGEQGNPVVGMDPIMGVVAELLAERNRLDALLTEALEQYAMFEEGLNARLGHADPDEAALLLAERARIEDMLGIAELVDRIDRIRERVALIESQRDAA